MSRRHSEYGRIAVSCVHAKGTGYTQRGYACFAAQGETNERHGLSHGGAPRDALPLGYKTGQRALAHTCEYEKGIGCDRILVQPW